jgi:hypothetical protein
MLPNIYILNHRHAQQNLQNFLQVAGFGLSVKLSSDLLNIKNDTEKYNFKKLISFVNFVVHDGGLEYINLIEAQRGCVT